MYIYMLYVYILYIYILSICLQKLSICIYTSFFKFHIHCLYSVYIQFHIDCIYRYRHVYVDGTKTCLYSVYMTYRQFQLLVYIAPLLYRRKNVYIIQTYRLQTLINTFKTWYWAQTRKVDQTVLDFMKSWFQLIWTLSTI